MIENVPLEKIDPNPWQSRQAENQTVVERVARSIAAEGLLQIPRGRRNPEDKTRVQLAFGHTRLAAFKTLNVGEFTNEPDQYAHMPIDISKIKDQRMAELAIRENRDREDLSPIDEALAIHNYINSFGATTTDAAELMDYKSAATVRSKMRLLRLPKPVQDLIHDGEIPERTGRRLLTLSRADHKKAVDIANKLTNEDLTPRAVERIISDGLDDVGKVICVAWDHGKVHGDFWDLTFDKFKFPMDVKPTVARDAVRPFYPDNKVANAEAKQMISRINEGITADHQIKKMAVDPVALDRIYHLLTPPPCSGCGYHAKAYEIDYCLLTPCYKTKKENWLANLKTTFKRKRNKLGLKGVEFYDRKTDGAKERSSWSGSTINKMIANDLETNAGENVRILARTNPSYQDHWMTGSKFFELVAVGDLLKPAEPDDDNGVLDQHQERQRQENNRAEAEVAIYFAAEPFTQAFAGIADWRLAQNLIRVMTEYYHPTPNTELHPYDKAFAKPKERIAQFQFWLAHQLIDGMTSWAVMGEGVDPTISHIIGVAKEIGVVMPDAWPEQAKEFVKKSLFDEEEENDD